MRQISPDKKRTYVYSKTQGRLKPNASMHIPEHTRSHFGGVIHPQ